MKKFFYKIVNLCLNEGGRGICSCVYKYVFVVFLVIFKLNLSIKWLSEFIEIYFNCFYYEFCNVFYNN